MNFENRTTDELNARLVEIREAGESHTEMTDEQIDALVEEKRLITAELEARAKKAAAEEAERQKIADGEIHSEVTKNFEEVRKMAFERNSTEYRDAWLATMAGKELTNEQRDAMTSATASGGYAIPEILQNKIYENMVQIAPMIGEIDVMHIPGNLTLAVESTVNAAAIHTEAASITPASDTITRIQLGGYEIVKVIGISAKLEAMSIPALEDWIVSNLSRKLAELVENYIINGDGSGEPAGIDSITWDTSTYTDCVDWASTAPTAAEIITLIGKLNAAYAPNAKFLMNWKTFWTEIFALRDDKNEPVVKQDGGFYRIFGFPVVISSKCVDDDIFFGDYREAVKANFAQDVEIEADKSSGFLTNTTNFRGRCLFDCNVITGRIVKGSANP